MAVARRERFAAATLFTITLILLLFPAILRAQFAVMTRRNVAEAIAVKLDKIAAVTHTLSVVIPTRQFADGTVATSGRIAADRPNTRARQ
jgi:hypothetical protein